MFLGSGYDESGFCHSNIVTFPTVMSDQCTIIVLYLHGPLSSSCTTTVNPVGRIGIFT